uniref:ATPase MORC2B-like isoform X2 n=1 Tax=Pristiophorus japonicus TaxID=55135 RepID=UPI00398EDD6B
MNPNPQQNSCDLPEQLPHIPLGTLTRESVLSDERQELLEKSIRQHREKVAALQFQKTFPIKPLTYKLPSDLSNKSLSKDISASESTPFPLSSSTRKRRIPTYYARPDRRSVSSERIPLSRNKYPKPSRYRKTVRIHGKSRPAAVSSEKQSYTSVHSTEENSIEKLFMASQPIKKHLQALQKEQVNTHNFKVEIPQREFAKKTKEEIIAVPVNNVYSKDPTSSKSKYMMQALVKKEPLKDGDTGGFIYQPCFHWEVKENVIVTFGSERFQNENVQDTTAGSSLSAPCSIAEHLDITKPDINNETVEGIVICFRQLYCILKITKYLEELVKTYEEETESSYLSVIKNNKHFQICKQLPRTNI